MAYFMLWKRAGTKMLKMTTLIGTWFPLGLEGDVESVNYSLICLEKSNISFNQNHITNLFTDDLITGPALPNTSLQSLPTDWIVTFTSINLIQFSPIQSIIMYQLHCANTLCAIQNDAGSDPVLEES